MNSGSSGSIQSSSGGEEEYDSGGEGMCGLLNNPHPPPHPHPHPPAPGDVGSMCEAKAKAKAKANPPAATHHPHNISSSSLFDPFSNLFDPLPTTRSHQNSVLNLDNPWPRNPRSEQHPIQLIPGSIPPSSSQITTQSFFMTTTTRQLELAGESNAYAPPPRELTLTTDPSDVLNNINNNNNNNNTPSSVRNPRKRTRASRRAPTTVLTTDTSNFRAMVQEFTGIPAPPFTPRARLDLFGAPSTSSSPPYLLRPFPQKLSPPFPNSPSTTSLLSPSSHFLLPKHNPHPHPHHVPTMSSIFNLHPPPPPPPPPTLQQPTHNSNINNLLPSLDTAQTTAENRNPQQPLPQELLGGNNNVATWGTGGPASDQALFRSFNPKYCTATKLNRHYSPSSSSDFHGDKGSDNVITRSEGMLESWICSSD